MKVIEITQHGGPEVLRMADRPVPAYGPKDVLVRVIAAGVNRPDVQQRKGAYMPPPGACDIPGLDIAGIVEKAGNEVDWPKVGDAVCALVTGGGYAEFCVAPALQCMPIPQGFTFIEAASLPEVFFTAWNNVMWLGRLAEGETFFVQGGTSGVGMAAIQIAKQLRQSRVLATAGTEEKCKVCLDIGADCSINYREGDWAAAARNLAGPRGIDVILDSQGGDYADKEIALLARDGRLVLIASHRGARAEVSLRDIYLRCLTVTGSIIRPRPPEYKGRIAKELVRDVWPLLSNGRIRTYIQHIFPLEEAAAAQSILDANAQIGKVVLTVDPSVAEQKPYAGTGEKGVRAVQ